MTGRHDCYCYRLTPLATLVARSILRAGDAERLPPAAPLQCDRQLFQILGSVGDRQPVTCRNHTKLWDSTACYRLPLLPSAARYTPPPGSPHTAFVTITRPYLALPPRFPNPTAATTANLQHHYTPPVGTGRRGAGTRLPHMAAVPLPRRASMPSYNSYSVVVLDGACRDIPLTVTGLFVRV